MAQEREFEDEIRLKPGGKSKAGTIKAPRLRNRFSNPNYINAISSGKSEAVVKVVGYTRGYRVKKVLDYISRIDNPQKDNVECENDMAAALMGEKDILETYDNWKKDFKKSKPGLSRKQRDAVHMMLSSDCENNNTNAKKVLAAAREVVKNELGDKGFDYVSALHRDGKKPHVHFVIKCKNRYKGRGKLRLNPPQLFKIRTKFAEKMTELGLDHVATMRKDRPPLMERVVGGIEQLQKNEKQFQRAMKRAAPSRDAFLYRKKASQTIVRLREQIKKETTPDTKERRDLLAKLRSVERQLTKKRPDIEKEIAATFNKYEKDFERFNKKLSSRPQADKSENLEKLLDKEKTALKINMSVARESIKNSDAPELVKKESFAVLDQYEKDMSRTLRKDLLKPKVYAFAKDFKSLNATANKALFIREEKPNTAVGKLEKRRQLDRLCQDLGKHIAATRKNIQNSTVSHGDKKTVLADLQKFENKVSKQLGRQLKPKGLSLTR